VKKIIFFILIQACLFTACRVLTSATSIAPAQSFVLGEGKHGSYTAQVKNASNSEVEVFQNQDNQQTSLGLLKPGEQTTYQVSANTMVIFKNLGKRQATLNIRLNGDTSLSMGYRANQ
jgi:hypothetical protein